MQGKITIGIRSCEKVSYTDILNAVRGLFTVIGSTITILEVRDSESEARLATELRKIDLETMADR